MSDRPSGTGSDQVSEAAAELYRLAPEEFVTARDERVRGLREDGNATAAKEVAALRKPTVGAWLVNLLVAAEPGLAEQVTALADQLRTAQEQLSGDDLRALGRQRQELVSGLVARTRGLAKEAGRAVAASVLDTEVESSLRAALADPEVAREVLSGRLTRAAEFTGFGAPSPAREGTTTKKTTGSTSDQGKRGKAAATKETAADRKRMEKLERAQERLREAEEALAAAEDEHVTAEKERAATAGALTAAQERRDQLSSQLDAAQVAQDEAAEKDEQARWRIRRAAAALTAAQASVTRARDASERLER